MRAVSIALAAALIVTPCAAAPSDAPTPTRLRLPFIDDDYPRALAEARERGLPLFVEYWTTWCHTCLSMREFVFTDAALERHAGRFVWLAIDAEKEINAPFLERFPVTGYPTLLVLDAATEQPALRWLGSATAPQLAQLFDDAAHALREPGAGGEAALAQADRLLARGDREQAAAAYRAAIDGAAPALAAA